jgi:hypothetical protein
MYLNAKFLSGPRRPDDKKGTVQAAVRQQDRRLSGIRDEFKIPDQTGEEDRALGSATPSRKYSSTRADWKRRVSRSSIVVAELVNEA